MRSARDAEGGGRLRRAISRLVTPTEQLEAEDLQRSAEDVGAMPCAAVRARERVRISGTLRTVTLRPRSGVPALEAELYDGSGTVRLVWLGRRRIAGIEPGRAITAEGRVAEGSHPQDRVLFNPWYELRPAAGG